MSVELEFLWRTRIPLPHQTQKAKLLELGFYLTGVPGFFLQHIYYDRELFIRE